MSETHTRPSAQIIAFPSRPSVERDARRVARAQDNTAARPVVDWGQAWYHDAAIAEEKRPS